MTKGVLDLIRMTETVLETVVQNKKLARYEERYTRMESFMQEESNLRAALQLIKTLDRKGAYSSAPLLPPIIPFTHATDTQTETASQPARKVFGRHQG